MVVPEGDSIYRTATALRAALLGKPLLSFEAPRHVGLFPNANAVVERVDSHGKHLEIGFDDAVILHTHMRMTGSWHLYRTGEQWRKPTSQARVMLKVPGWQAICFNAPVVEIYRAREATRHPGLGSLGPDLCRAGVDIVECVARIERYCAGDSTVAEVLLDQRIACGVGNVFKSEVLWACQVHPLSPIESLSIDQRFRLLETVASMLQANVERVDRVTVPDVPGGTAVYGRTGKPCFRCGSTIEVRKHGQQARVTYFCPGCQVQLGVPIARQVARRDDEQARAATVADDPSVADDAEVEPDATVVGGPWLGDDRDAADHDAPDVDAGDGDVSGPTLMVGRRIGRRAERIRANAATHQARPLRNVDPLLARRAAQR